MNQGEIIQNIRFLQRDVLVQEERIKTLEKKVAEQQELLNSPIRRAVHIAREKKETTDATR